MSEGSTGTRRVLPAACAVLALIGGFAWSSDARAQAAPQGAEFQVNAATTGGQSYPRIAVGPQGDFVVVWMSYAQHGADVDGAHVAARRFGADGTPLGDEFQVNSSSEGYQNYTDVARAPGGEFIVVWQSDASAGDDADGKSVQGQRFSSSGIPAGSEFQVNTTTTGDQYYPAVAVDAATGEFVVVWEDAPAHEIRGRRFAADGQPAGTDFAISDVNDYAAYEPRLGFLAGGGFVVAWSAAGSFGTDDEFRSIQARHFDGNDAPAGATFQVNTTTTGRQEYPVVVTDGDERYVVAWQSGASSGDDSSGMSVQAQRYDAGGAVGGELQVNTQTTLNQALPALAMDSRGNVVVAWMSRDASNDPDWSVEARRLSVDGSFIDEASFQVNSYTTGYQEVPAVGVDALGNFVVAWYSGGSAGTDTASWSVQARRFDGVFREGFEGGDLSRWTQVLSGLPSS